MAKTKRKSVKGTRPRAVAVTAAGARGARRRSGASGGAADQALRRQLVDLLKSRNAHLDFDDVIEGFGPADRGRRPAGAPHSAWQLLEHLRICQSDILEFSRDPAHVSPKFPEGLWPATKPPDPKAWTASVRAFRRDREAMARLVADPRHDLFARIDHPEARPKHTLLREALVLADHNAYHIGQLVALLRGLAGH